MRLRKRGELLEHRRAELVDAGERQLHLRFYARDLGDTESSGLTSGVAQQRRLSDARLAPDDEDRALTRAQARQEAVEYFALVGPADKPGPGGGRHIAATLANR